MNNWIMLCFVFLIGCSCFNILEENGERTNRNQNPDLNVNNYFDTINKNETRILDSNFLISNVEILSFNKKQDKRSSFNGKYSKGCENWEMSKSDLEDVLIKSRKIDGHEFHYFFDILPCSYSGEVVINRKIRANFEVNAGASSTIILDDTSYFLGYYEKKYFISYPSID